MNLMEKLTLLRLFNENFEEFLDEIIDIFPTDSDILSTKVSVKLLRKSNPKLLLTVWNEHVRLKYGEHINEGNLHFFLEKDYTDDLKENLNSNKIIEVIDRIRQPLKQLNNDQLESVLCHLKNLNTICSKIC